MKAQKFTLLIVEDDEDQQIFIAAHFKNSTRNISSKQCPAAMRLLDT